MSRGCPAKFISILKNWFSNTTKVVKWGDALSSPVRFSTGVRQGNVLSPLLFGLFVNELLSSLSESGQGCHIKFTPFNVFMFADDLLIVCPSIISLQVLVDKCITKLKAMDMTVNASKSSCIRIVPGCCHPVGKVIINGTPISWSESLSYLGITFKAESLFRCDLHNKKAKYFSSINSIFSKIGNHASPYVLLSIIFSKCIPILFYGLEAITLPKAQLDSITFV